MAVPPFPQKREAELLAFSTNFSAMITAAPATYGLTAAQATAYAALHSAFATAYADATNPATNSKANVILKNTAKENLLNGPGGAWELVDIVQAFPGTTDFMRGELNIRIPDVTPTPVPVPTAMPDIDIISSFGRSVKIRLHDKASDKNKPAGVRGATVFSFVGPAAPVDIDSWKFEGSTTKSVFDVEFPATVANGSTVWLTAYWTNAKLQSGPPASPVSTNIPGGLSMAA